MLGSGTSTGVPRVGNDWGDCDPHEPRNRRTRVSILVESNEGKRLLVDTSTGSTVYSGRMTMPITATASMTCGYCAMGAADRLPGSLRKIRHIGFVSVLAIFSPVNTVIQR